MKELYRWYDTYLLFEEVEVEVKVEVGMVELSLWERRRE